MQRLIDKEWKKGLLIFSGLVLFHLAVSVLLSLIARSTFLASMHNGQGFWIFALDSITYHDEAFRLLELLRDGDYAGWWETSQWWHTKWIALSYGILAPDPLSFAPINALIWSVSVVCVYKIVCQLFPHRSTLTVVSAVVFGLWPSYFLHTTQLLKEPFYVLGILLMIWGWIGLLSGRGKLSFVFFVGLGVLIALLIRTHILEVLLSLSLLAMILVLWRARGSSGYALLTLLLLAGLYLFHQQRAPVLSKRVVVPQAQVQQNQPKTTWQYLGWLPDWFEFRCYEIGLYRDLWISLYPESGSNIDTEVFFHSALDVVKYSPRALQIGYLAPFPTQWFENAKTAGRGSRVVAGIEMLAWYFLLPGFLYFLTSSKLLIQTRIWLLMFSITLVLLTSLIVVNIGALYRIRYVYLFPILIGGLEGWSRFYAQRFQKTAS